MTTHLSQPCSRWLICCRYVNCVLRNSTAFACIFLSKTFVFINYWTFLQRLFFCRERQRKPTCSPWSSCNVSCLEIPATHKRVLRNSHVSSSCCLVCGTNVFILKWSRYGKNPPWFSPILCQDRMSESLIIVSWYHILLGFPSRTVGLWSSCFSHSAIPYQVARILCGSDFSQIPTACHIALWYDTSSLTHDLYYYIMLML